MQNKLSDDLVMISTMMMVAKERGEFIQLASELNSTIQKALEIEKSGIAPKENKKTLSATIKFTKQEIDKMSKTFKKEFIANGCVSHIIKRPSGRSGFYYEIRYRRNGYNISVSNKDLKKAKELFIVATYNLQTPEITRRRRLAFKDILMEFIEYKKDKVSMHTWQTYNSRANNYFETEFLNKRIEEIHTIDIDRFMRKFTNEPRTYEEMRTLLNSVFKYSIASGIITHNPVTLVPFKRAKRNNRSALTNEQITEFLKRLKEPTFDEIRQAAYVLYFFGIRPCELDGEARFENGFFICRNRKRKNGLIEYKKIPIPKQAQGLIDFERPILFPYSTSSNLNVMKKALGNGLTPYNLRHTFATLCSQAVSQEIVEVWMGDSSERLVGRVYVHYSDEFMKAQMDKVDFPVK